jgi:uncharacterized protein (DUF1778 family)
MQSRIRVRMPPAAYATLHRAAELTGMTVNKFLVQAA